MRVSSTQTLSTVIIRLATIFFQEHDQITSASCIKYPDYLLKKWKMDYIPLPIKIVHSDTIDDAPMN